MYDADGQLNEAVPYDALGRYAYYAQAGVPLAGAEAGGVAPLVGVTEGGTALYLLGGASGDGAADGEGHPHPAGAGSPLDGAGMHAPSAVGVLDRAALSALPGHDGPRVVWGTACRLGGDLLDEHGVTFRQIPYDLRTR